MTIEQQREMVNSAETHSHFAEPDDAGRNTEHRAGVLAAIRDFHSKFKPPKASKKQENGQNPYKDVETGLTCGLGVRSRAKGIKGTGLKKSITPQSAGWGKTALNRPSTGLLKLPEHIKAAIKALVQTHIQGDK